MIDDEIHHRSGAPNARREAYTSYLSARGLPAHVQLADNSVRGGADAMDALLSAFPGVTAVFGYNDLIAIGAMRRAMRRGLRVPDDCAFLGFDGLTLGELVDPELTTVHIDKHRFGQLAVEQIATVMTGGAVTPQLVRPTLVTRLST